MNKKNFIKTVLIMFLMAMPLGASAEVLKGDVNGDGKVSINDVAVLINYLLTDDPTGVNLENADTYVDGKINIDDVTSLIEIMLNVPDEPEPEHEYVDLGLPSGTLWAICNVGANAPEEYGDYFAWGETEPKEVYDLTTYKWNDGTWLKYTADGKTELDPEDDAAYVNWGAEWCMPTKDQLDELISNCTWTWTILNGVRGRLVTGPNGNTLFMPAAGGREGSSPFLTSYGFCWSRSLFTHSHAAYMLGFNSSYLYCGYHERYMGFNVRAVRAPEEPQHEYVDLGLPSGTLWATCNVGANSPEEYGDYFAWGETEAKDYYYFSNTKWVIFINGAYCYLTKYCTRSEDGYNGFTDGKTELDPEDDAAYVNWGPLWRMPTLDQQKELIDNCSSTWTAHNGVYGYQVTGHNGNSIFLPVAGQRWQDSLYGESFGFYWSRTLGDYSGSAYFLLVKENFSCGYGYRSYGHSVRAVRVSQD